MWVGIMLIVPGADAAAAADIMLGIRPGQNKQNAYVKKEGK